MSLSPAEEDALRGRLHDAALVVNAVALHLVNSPTPAAPDLVVHELTVPPLTQEPYVLVALGGPLTLPVVAPLAGEQLARHALTVTAAATSSAQAVLMGSWLSRALLGRDRWGRLLWGRTGSEGLRVEDAEADGGTGLHDAGGVPQWTLGLAVTVQGSVSASPGGPQVT